MATLEDLQFETERRVIIFKSITTLPDKSSLGYDGDPNLATTATAGQTLLVDSPLGVFYSQDNGALWYKSVGGSLGTWTLIMGAGGSDGGEPIYIGPIGVDDTWMIVRDIDNNFTTLGITSPLMLNDGKLHFFRRESGVYVSKSQMGDSVHTDRIFINKLSGGYHIPSGTGQNLIALRKANRATHNIVAGNYFGTLFLASDGKDGLKKAYAGRGEIVTTSVDLDVNEFRSGTEFKFTVLSVDFPNFIKELSAWIDVGGIGVGYRIEFLEQSNILYESQTVYAFKKFPRFILDKVGKNTLVLENPIPIDSSTSLDITLQFTTSIGLRFSVNSATIPHFETKLHEIIIEDVSTTSDLGESEWSQAIDGNNHHTIHDGNLEWLTDKHGNPLQTTRYHNELGTTDLIIARELGLGSLHNGDNQMITDTNGNVLDFSAL